MYAYITIFMAIIFLEKNTIPRKCTHFHFTSFFLLIFCYFALSYDLAYYTTYNTYIQGNKKDSKWI